jgi:hypothetical protein
MIDAIKAWFKSDSAKRVGRTLIEVFGPVVVLLLLDYGHDGVVVIRDYIFGDTGFIVVGTMALAVALNIKPVAKSE